MENQSIMMNDGLDDLFVLVPQSSSDSEKITAPRYSYWKSVGRVFFRKKSNWVFLALLAVIIVMSIFYPMISPGGPEHNPNVSNLDSFNLSPINAIKMFGFKLSWIFGTDGGGGSVFDYLWTGSRTSLALSSICTIINMTIGVILGAVWGLSKTFDTIMNQIYNIIGNIPYILLITVLAYIIGTGFWSFVLALSITGWLGIAYFIRTQVIIIRDREYNLASRCLGTNIFTIVFKNILPFMISVIVTLLASELPSYISYEVFLSYINVGLSANIPSLGRMINDGQKVWMSSPWRFWPAVIVSAIISVVLYVVGQNVGDASDPRTHMS
ncbi:MAG: ABC transporter permease [Bacillales bacterium]|nr:ABC transporter permease [Bacillales bacterium]